MSSVNFGPVSSNYSQPSGAVAFKGKPTIKQIVNSTKLNNIEKSTLIQNKLLNNAINMPQIIQKAIEKFLKFILKKVQVCPTDKPF